MTAPDLPAIIARLRRAQPRNPDTNALCEAAEALRLTVRRQDEMLDLLRKELAEWKQCASVEAGLRREAFDRINYQRAYMRDARAAKKLGISTAEYRKRT